jgi:hypothetical protein
MVANASVEAGNAAELVWDLEGGILDLELVDGLINGGRDLLKNGMVDKVNK